MERVEYPCRNRLDTTNIRPYDPSEPDYVPVGRVDDNSCIEGSIIGGIIGGGLGGVLATKDNWIWSIPTGVVGGAMTGCQVDGG